MSESGKYIKAITAEGILYDWAAIERDRLGKFKAPMTLMQALLYAKDHPRELVKPLNRANDQGAIYYTQEPRSVSDPRFDTGFFMTWPWNGPDYGEELFIRSNDEFFGYWVVIDPDKFFNEV